MFDDGNTQLLHTRTQLHERLEVRLQCEHRDQSASWALVAQRGTPGRPLFGPVKLTLPDRLLYSPDAQFKLAHDRIAHTLDELEILYLRPFRTQARKRARERRDDPDRREWLQAAATVDDARPGETEAHGARVGVLVFDGEQPTLLQLEPEAAEERARRVRKRRQAAVAATLDWASPPPPTKAKRPASKRLVRPDSLPQVPARPDMLATADTTAPTPSAAAAPSSSSLKPLERDTQNRLAQYTSPARTARVYSVPSAREEKGTDGATTSGNRGEPFLGLTTSEGPLFSPVELHGPARAGPSPQAFDPASPPSNRRLSRRRTSAISPFSSRSTLESTGETLAPASSINSLQHTSSNETSPRLAHAIVPPPPPALSLLSSMRKTLLTSSGNSSGTDHGGALDEDDDAFPPLTRIHQRPGSESSERGSLTATGSQAAAAAAEVPQMLTTASTSSVLPRAATATDHLPFLGAQPSFSALPPVPPLPFDLAPSYNSTLGLHASFSQLRSSYPSDAETSSSWARTSGSRQGKSAIAGDVYATTMGSSQPTAAKGGNRSLRFSAANAPSSSPGWEVSFAPPPRGSETRPVSQSSTAEAIVTSLRLEQDVLRRFSAAVDDQDQDGDGSGMGASLYPPLSQETVLDSGQSQETGDASVDDEEDEEEGDARGQNADADSAAEETQEESQLS